MTFIKCQNCGHIQRTIRRNIEVSQCSKCNKKIWIKASIVKNPGKRKFNVLTKIKYDYNVRCWKCNKGFNPTNLRDAKIEIICPKCRALISDNEIKLLKMLNKRVKNGVKNYNLMCQQ